MSNSSSGAIVSQVMTVSVDQADKWLKANTRNRTIQQKIVADYARDMLTHKWAVNGEALKIAIDGTILDGQHRLLACVLAGVPFETFVVTGLPLSAQDSMDGGRKRTTADMFRIHGEKDVNLLASVTRRLWLWDRGDRRFASNPVPTKAESSAFLAAHPMIRTSVEIGTKTYHAFPYLSATALGTAHYLMAGVNTYDADDFFQKLATGSNLPQHHPVLTLRKRALRDDDTSMMTPSMALVVSAWNAYRAGRELITIVYDPSKAIKDPK